MYVLDSSAIIEIIEDYSTKETILSLLKDEILTITSITVHEVLLGVVTEKQKSAVHTCLYAARILEHDEAAARHGALIEQELTRAGTKINRFDVLIAGICKSNNAHLVTLDADFSKIKDLSVTVIK